MSEKKQMIKNTAKYPHSLRQTAVMIPAEPSKPVMMRRVRLLYLVREVTENLVAVRMASKL
jgi:hypothetical protein